MRLRTKSASLDVLLISAILSFLWFLIGRSDNFLPAYLVVPSTIFGQTPSSDRTVSLLLTGRCLETGASRRSVRLDFVLVNRSDEAIEFTAYPSHTCWASICPLYHKQIKTDGEWVTKPLWCG